MTPPPPPLSPAPPPALIAEPDARVRHVPEAVLQALWADGRFDRRALATAEGTPLQILSPGLLNRDGGPDFREARIRLEGPEGAITWTGDVEVHRTSGEWLLHRHDEDPRYDRVVLHVVLLADRHTGSLRRADGTALPELVLDGRLEDSLRHLLYRFFTHPRPDFPCAPLWHDVNDETRRRWLRRLGLERLRARVEDLGARFARRPDLAALLHAAAFRALGYAPNAEPMTELARRVPLDTLRRIADPRDVEAALFGVSGLLPEPVDLRESERLAVDYVEDLRARFERLRTTHRLQPMEPVRWQFFRLRPANFPTRRIAQAAALLMSAGGARGLLLDDPLGQLREAFGHHRPVAALRARFQAAEPDPFWQDHVRFERATAPGSAAIGRDRADRLLMDAALPVLLLDTAQREDVAQEEAVAAALTSLPGAEDAVTRLYTRPGERPESALLTQGYHHLHRAWCEAGRCLDCAVGQEILKRG